MQKFDAKKVLQQCLIGRRYNSISIFSKLYLIVSILNMIKASGNVEFGTLFDATNSFDLYIGSNKEFPMMGLR
jgi:hypothetical protein